MKRGILVLCLFLISILFTSGCNNLQYGSRDFSSDETNHTASIEIRNVNIEEKTLDIFLTHNNDTAGFQFDLIDIGVTGAYGGSSEEHEFIVNTNDPLVLGFTMTGNFIPPGTNLLTTVSFSDQLSEGDEICFGTDQNKNVISDGESNPFNTTWGGCYEVGVEIEGCTDQYACNYDPGVTISCGSEGADDDDWIATWINPALVFSYGSSCESFINAILENTASSSLGGVCGSELIAPAFLNLGDYFSSCGDSCYELLSDVCTSTCEGSCCIYTEDCSGTCGGELVNDCAGVCGGSSVEDDCGICGGSCEICGCTGECDGSVIDECGICGGNGDCSSNGAFVHQFEAGTNLASFPVLPEDNSVENVFESLDSISGIIQEGAACHQDIGGWMGCLTSISYDRGYWIILGDDETLMLSGIPAPEITYNIHEGANLISYPLETQSIEDALPEGHCVETISTDGSSTMWLNDEQQWIGSLVAFDKGKGYWVKSSCDFDLIFEQPRTSKDYNQEDSFLYGSRPSNLFQFSSSTQQAFYFISSKFLIDEALLKVNDVLIAYNKDTDKTIGSVIYEGQNTIVLPAMGDMGTSLDPQRLTEGYANMLSEIEIKIFRNGDIKNLELEVPEWMPWEVFYIEKLDPTPISTMNKFINFIKEIFR